MSRLCPVEVVERDGKRVAVPVVLGAISKASLSSRITRMQSRISQIGTTISDLLAEQTAIEAEITKVQAIIDQVDE